MRWYRGDEYFIASDPPGFVISRAHVLGRICYMAAQLRERGASSTILHVERDLDPNDDAGRLAALDRCKAACARAAGER